MASEALEIRPISFNEIPLSIIEEGKAHRISFPDKSGVCYFGGFIDGSLISLICLVINKNKTGRIKSNFTVEEYRDKGYFTQLNRYCLGYAKDCGVTRILLNCLDDSVGVHERCGARVFKKTKTITYMIYDEEQIHG